MNALSRIKAVPSLASLWLDSTLHSTGIPQRFSVDSRRDSYEGGERKQEGTAQALKKGGEAALHVAGPLVLLLPHQLKECERRIWEQSCW